MIGAGELRELLQIIPVTNGEDASGTNIDAEGTPFTVYGKRRGVKPETKVAYLQHNLQIEVEFIVRDDPRINTRCKVVHQGQKYDIETADPIGFNEFTRLLCSIAHKRGPR